MTTPVYLSPLTFIVQYFTNLGVIAAGGSVQTNLAGSSATLQTTYTDSTGLVANSNPLTLNSAARPAGQSGALTAFWQPAGVSIDAYFTDVLGESWSIKNISGINDPTAQNSLQALLASPASSNAAGSGPVAGVDLVANALKSYDVFADVRAANAPALAPGQTLTISVQGAAAINDGLGGDFYWNATATTADNGTSVLRPNSVGISGAGRWLRLYTPPIGATSTLGSAATTDLGTAGSNFVDITGSVGITSFGASASQASPLYFVYFGTGGNLLTYASPALILPGGQNILTSIGDSALCYYRGSGNWQVLAYFRLLTSPPDSTYYVKTADQPVTNSTVLVPDTALTTGILAGGDSYLVQLRLLLLGTATTLQGYKIELNFSGSVTGLSSGSGVATSNLTPAAVIANLNAALSQAAISDTAGSPDMVNMDFLITPSSGGTLAVEFAQATAEAGATTMKAGSAMIVTRLN